MGTEPDRPTIKKLFALTGNTCAFQSLDDGRGCELELARPEWPRTQGQIAHIRGERPTSARYDERMTDHERAAFENLIVLCPTHHHFVDYVEPDRYTVEVLTAMKDRHERSGPRAWASEADLERYATLVLAYQFGVLPSEGRTASDVAGGSDAATTGDTFRRTASDVAGGSDAATAGGTDSGGVSAARPHVTANAGVATGSGAALDPTVETSSPPGQVIQLEGVPIAVKTGGLTTVPLSPAVEKDSAGGAALLMEDGSRMLTEDGGGILLEGETASE